MPEHDNRSGQNTGGLPHDDERARRQASANRLSALSKFHKDTTSRENLSNAAVIADRKVMKQQNLTFVSFYMEADSPVVGAIDDTMGIILGEHRVARADLPPALQKRLDAARDFRPGSRLFGRTTGAFINLPMSQAVTYLHSVYSSTVGLEAGEELDAALAAIPGHLRLADRHHAWGPWFHRDVKAAKFYFSIDDMLGARGKEAALIFGAETAIDRSHDAHIAAGEVAAALQTGLRATYESWKEDEDLDGFAFNVRKKYYKKGSTEMPCFAVYVAPDDARTLGKFSGEEARKTLQFMLEQVLKKKMVAEGTAVLEGGQCYDDVKIAMRVTLPNPKEDLAQFVTHKDFAASGRKGAVTQEDHARTAMVFGLLSGVTLEQVQAAVEAALITDDAEGILSEGTAEEEGGDMVTEPRMIRGYDGEEAKKALDMTRSRVFQPGGTQTMAELLFANPEQAAYFVHVQNKHGMFENLARYAHAKAMMSLTREQRMAGKKKEYEKRNPTSNPGKAWSQVASSAPVSDAEWGKVLAKLGETQTQLSRMERQATTGFKRMDDWYGAANAMMIKMDEKVRAIEESTTTMLGLIHQIRPSVLKIDDLEQTSSTFERKLLAIIQTQAEARLPDEAERGRTSARWGAGEFEDTREVRQRRRSRSRSRDGQAHRDGGRAAPYENRYLGDGDTRTR